MTARELIDILEQFPPDLPVVENGCEITDVFVRDEMYFTEEHRYNEGQIIKVY